MKRMIILIGAAIVILTSAVLADRCRFDEDVDNNMDCECEAPYCYGTGYIEISYTCPCDPWVCYGGPCLVCQLNYDGENLQPIYAEPDCAPYPWLDPCPEATCYVEGYDQSTIIWEDTGNCECT